MNPKNLTAAIVAGLVLLSCVPSLRANTVTLVEQVCRDRGFGGLEYCYKVDVKWERRYDHLRHDNVFVRIAVVSDVYMKALYESRNGPIPDGRSLLGLSEITKLSEPMRYGIGRFPYLCTIYLLDADDVDTYQHELMHCRGWAHD